MEQTTTSIFHSLCSYADDLNISIIWHSKTPVDGFYSHNHRAISLKHGMSDAQTNCVLAHELAHAIHGDFVFSEGHTDPRLERRADQWAASYLISLEEYAQAERIVGSNTATLAEELGVTKHILKTWREMHLKRANLPNFTVVDLSVA